MTSIEARQRVIKIVCDDCYQGVMDVVNGNKQSDDVTRKVIQSLCDLCYDLIDSLPDEGVRKFSRWKTYDCFTIRDESDKALRPEEAIKIYNDLVDRLERAES